MWLTILHGLLMCCLVLCSLGIAFIGVSIVLEAISDWWHTRQQHQRDAVEAELDRTATELHETITRLAEALAEEKVAAEVTRREMMQVSRSAPTK